MNRLLLIVTVLLFSSLAGISQNRGGQRNFDAKEMAERRTKQITGALDLSKDQQEKIGDILLSSAEKMKELRDEMRSGGGFSDEMRDKMRKMRDDERKEIEKVLNDEQKDKYAKWLKEQANRRRDKQRR